MGLILLEALLALVLLAGIVWWTMFSGRRRGERSHAPTQMADTQLAETQIADTGFGEGETIIDPPRQDQRP